MPDKTRDTIRPESRSKGPNETETFEQVWGTTNPQATERRSARMPHERDESAGATGSRLDQQVASSQPEIAQAQKDVESGQLDTDRRGIPDDIPGGPANKPK